MPATPLQEEGRDLSDPLSHRTNWFLPIMTGGGKVRNIKARGGEWGVHAEH